MPCPLPAVCPPRRPGVDWTQELTLHLNWLPPPWRQPREGHKLSSAANIVCTGTMLFMSQDTNLHLHLQANQEHGL